MLGSRVLIGASAGPGLAGLQTVHQLRLGNCVLADLPNDLQEGLAMARFCREHQLVLFLSELVFRGSKDLWRPSIFGCTITGHEPTDVRGVKFLTHSSLPDYRLPVADVNCDPRYLGNFTPAKLELTTARVLAGHDIFFGAAADQLARQPVLLENRLGDGVAMLVTLYEYPADEAVVGLTEELLRVISAGEQADLRLLGSDRIRYAVYESDDAQVIYLLNTDPDTSAAARLWIDGRLTDEFLIPPNEMTVAYRLGSLLIIAEDKCLELDQVNTEAELSLDFLSVRPQTLALHNLALETTVLTINGLSAAIEPGAVAELTIARRAPAQNMAFAEDFAEEPKIEGEIDPHTAY